MPSSPNGCTASAEWLSPLGCCQQQNSSSASAPPLSAPTTLTSLSPTLTSLSPRMPPENALASAEQTLKRKPVAEPRACPQPATADIQRNAREPRAEACWLLQALQSEERLQDRLLNVVVGKGII